MTKSETQLLENLFDCLDRLFDRECGTVDVYNLLFATEKLITSIPDLNLDHYLSGVEQIMRNRESDEVQREMSLAATDSLRHKLNELFLANNWRI